MKDTKLPTESYKGVRDFYPAEMAIQRYLFETWSKTAEAFGFEEYSASVLEPSDIYRSKGAQSEEIVNDQTYTFTDRGEREVTLRPEMTPTAARLVAANYRDLTFPLRWYALPNLFRYERPQRGRLREHWQLNCDIFGSSDIAADIEIIALAYQLLIDFGASPEMFVIRVNDRADMTRQFNTLGITEESTITAITRLNDTKKKISASEYTERLETLVADPAHAEAVRRLVEATDGDLPVLAGLREIGISNAILDRTIARGFAYYTGTIFEIFDTHPGGSQRSLLGGGRYDNLASLFTNEKIPGVGFGMGDVGMQDFLKTHKLLPAHITTTAATLHIIPLTAADNLEAEKTARIFRARGINTAVDFGPRKLGKKISDAALRGVRYALIVGADEIATQQFTLKNLTATTEETGLIPELLASLLATV